MYRYHVIKRVKKLIKKLSLHLKEYSGLGKNNNPAIAKVPNLKDDLFQELGKKQSQSEIKEVDLPKYLFI